MTLIDSFTGNNFALDVIPTTCQCGGSLATYIVTLEESNGAPLPVSNAPWLSNDPTIDQFFRIVPESAADIGTYTITLEAYYPLVNPSTGSNW